MKIYSNQELKDMQLSGAQPTYEWDLLNTKYKDKFKVKLNDKYVSFHFDDEIELKKIIDFLYKIKE